MMSIGVTVRPLYVPDFFLDRRDRLSFVRSTSSEAAPRSSVVFQQRCNNVTHTTQQQLLRLLQRPTRPS
jgi:hypothetical protein